LALLAFDTSTAICAVGVVLADGTVDEVADGPERLHARPAHTRELLPAIDAVLNRSGLSMGDVDGVAVGIGPGAFTGLRIGVATARAIATASGAPLTPVSSLAALALGAAEGPEHAAILTANDARRSEFYCSLRGAVGQVIAEDRVCPETELLDLVQRFSAPGEVVAVGDAVEGLRDRLTALGVTVPEPGDRRHVVRASSVVRLAADSAPAPVNEVVPNYIRPPDAKQSSRASWVAALTGPSGSR
jgi:tRNA threonylcarbamoyladenosine biosynthesis protein TsaB